MAGLFEGLPTLPVSVLDALNGGERVAVDTRLANGSDPQTVGATTFQIAALAAGMIANVGTVATGTVTINAYSGLANSGALTTAAGSTSTFTIVNSLATAGSPVEVGLSNGTNTVPGAVVSAAINNAGTIAVTITNDGTAALNGSLLVPFLVGGSV